MDSLSQFVLGSAVGYFVAGRKAPRTAVIAGGLLATVPDLDVLIDYGDALQNTIHHRTWSHSWLVQTALSPMMAWVLHRFLPGLTLWRWMLLVWLVWVTHGALDGTTIYGTALFWPLAIPSVMQANLFIIDPIVTLPLLLGVVGILVRPDALRARRGLIWGAGLSLAYIGWSLFAQTMMMQRFERTLAEAGLSVQQVVVTPSPFNTLMWRGLAVGESAYYETVMSVFDGEQRSALHQLPRSPALRAAMRGHEVFEAYQRFSQGFFALSERDGVVVIKDLRMGTGKYLPFVFEIARTVPDSAGVGRVEVLGKPVHVSVPRFPEGLFHRLLLRIVDTDIPFP